MKRITEKGWKREAQRRVRKAIKNLESGWPEGTGHCPVCEYMSERGIIPSPSIGCSDSYGVVKCPASATCRIFLRVIEDMLYRGSQIKNLKVLLRSLEK